MLIASPPPSFPPLSVSQEHEIKLASSLQLADLRSCYTTYPRTGCSTVMNDMCKPNAAPAEPPSKPVWSCRRAMQDPPSVATSSRIAGLSVSYTA